MGFRDRLAEVSGYNGCDFHSADSIGIICRGPSVHRLDLCHKKFNHCFLAGEFNHTLSRIEKYIMGKQIVLSIMQHRYMTSKENCKKFNINNLQIRWQEGCKEHKRCVQEFPYLRVSGYNQKHYDIVARINEDRYVNDRSIFSTGISGIIAALNFYPKKIHIIGLDFYNKVVKPYYVREDNDTSGVGRIRDSMSGLRGGMIDSLNQIVFLYPNIDFNLYTTYGGIKSKNNLRVKYV